MAFVKMNDGDKLFLRFAYGSPKIKEGGPYGTQYLYGVEVFEAEDRGPGKMIQATDGDGQPDTYGWTWSTKPAVKEMLEQAIPKIKGQTILVYKKKKGDKSEYHYWHLDSDGELIPLLPQDDPFAGQPDSEETRARVAASKQAATVAKPETKERRYVAETGYEPTLVLAYTAAQLVVRAASFTLRDEAHVSDACVNTVFIELNKRNLQRDQIQSEIVEAKRILEGTTESLPTASSNLGTKPEEPIDEPSRLPEGLTKQEQAVFEEIRLSPEPIGMKALAARIKEKHGEHYFKTTKEFTAVLKKLTAGGEVKETENGEFCWDDLPF